MIDTHAHIDLENYEGRVGEIVENARKNGVFEIIIPSVNSKSFKNIINLVEEHDSLFGALGVHPEDLEGFGEGVVNEIIRLSSHPKIVAIGEIGLDYYWDKSNIEGQKEAFRLQIEAAKKVGKPVLVHDRDAHEDTFKILKETNAAEVGVVMHCFSGSVEFAKECVKEGFYIALGGVTTFKNAKKAKEVAKAVPLDRLLLETDSPYMTPVPFRGKENEPAYVRYVAEEIALLRGITIEEVDKATTENSYRLFKAMKNG